MGIIGAIIIGFLAGLIAKWITPGDHKPRGFILTTVLGIVGSVLATWLGQQVGWYNAGDGAGFIASILGAVIILLAWGQLARRAGRYGIAVMGTETQKTAPPGAPFVFAD